MAPLLTDAKAKGKLIGLICDGTVAGAKAGLLDAIRHTSNGDGYLDFTGYQGKALYRDTPAAVTDGRVKFFPQRYANTYLDWLGEKRDWCISRQLWWGHRIPVWRKLGTKQGPMPGIWGDPVDESELATPQDWERLLAEARQRDGGPFSPGPGIVFIVVSLAVATIAICVRMPCSLSTF